MMRLAESCRLEQSRECIQSILRTFQQSGVLGGSKVGEKYGTLSTVSTAITATFSWLPAVPANCNPGARPLVETNSRKPCRIAAQEIQAQKVSGAFPSLSRQPSRKLPKRFRPTTTTISSSAETGPRGTRYAPRCARHGGQLTKRLATAACASRSAHATRRSLVGSLVDTRA